MTRLVFETSAFKSFSSGQIILSTQLKKQIIMLSFIFIDSFFCFCFLEEQMVLLLVQQTKRVSNPLQNFGRKITMKQLWLIEAVKYLMKTEKGTCRINMLTESETSVSVSTNSRQDYTHVNNNNCCTSLICRIKCSLW